MKKSEIKLMVKLAMVSTLHELEMANLFADSCTPEELESISNEQEILVDRLRGEHPTFIKGEDIYNYVKSLPPKQRVRKISFSTLARKMKKLQKQAGQ